MTNNIFVPNKIKVGYQNRSDTYTQKLAYIIYYDQGNKLRKETSWNNWRDKEIEANDFNNIPTEGFILNKKVGDYGRWQHRQAYIRVYDPRGFEFEITVENLLYILQNTNSLKGGKLQGEFVYGWDGANLILIPTSAPDYKEIIKYNQIVHKNDFVKAKELKIGATYLQKDNIEMIYLGKFNYYDCYCKLYDDNNKQKANGKYFWFAYKSTFFDEWHFEAYKSINKKFISCVDEKFCSEYDNILNKMEHSVLYSPVDKSKNEYIKYEFDDFKENVKQNQYWKTILARVNCDFIECDLRIIGDKYIASVNDSCGNKVDLYGTKPVDLEEIYNKLNPHYCNVYLANGNFYTKIY